MSGYVNPPQTTFLDALERHRESGCRECSQFHVCETAAALLSQFVELTVSIPSGPAKERN